MHTGGSRSLFRNESKSWSHSIASSSSIEQSSRPANLPRWLSWRPARQDVLPSSSQHQPRWACWTRLHHRRESSLPSRRAPSKVGPRTRRGCAPRQMLTRPRAKLQRRRCNRLMRPAQSMAAALGTPRLCRPRSTLPRRPRTASVSALIQCCKAKVSYSRHPETMENHRFTH